MIGGKAGLTSCAFLLATSTRRIKTLLDASRAMSGRFWLEKRRPAADLGGLLLQRFNSESDMLYGIEIDQPVPVLKLVLLLHNAECLNAHWFMSLEVAREECEDILP